ncbi:neprilysin-4-like [Drosophila teissieri]|uniref:neprilysin-4-like n=1 Tax=Drosophila teissieri TaxID=7243 RepID=UPI001CB9F793|nr:neprilysin-4-like [Drosophila teissieri]
MFWIASLLIFPICAATTAQNAESHPNSRLMSNILSYVEEDSSACDNYYQHACGRYAARHIDDPFTEITQMLDHKVNGNLVQLMDELQQRSRSPGFNESSVEAKALRFYQTCRDAPQSTRKMEHYLRLTSPAEAITWPHFAPRGEPWPKDHFNWMQALGHLYRYGFTNVLVNVLALPSVKNRDHFRLDISMPSLEGNAQHLDSFLNTLATLNAMGVPKKSSIPLARKIRRLESAIRVLTEVDDDDNSETWTLRQWEHLTGYAWQDFIESIVGHSVSNQLLVQAQNVKYFKGLKRLMDSTDAEVVAYYIMTRFVLYLLDDSMDSSEPIDCVKDVRRTMTLASDLLYEERFLDAATLQQYTQEVTQIFDQLRRHFLLQIGENRLGLTREQSSMVATKAQHVVLNIGNMPRGLDHRSFVSRHYEDLVFPLADFDYAREHLNLLEFRTRKQLLHLDQRAPSPGEFFYLAEPSSAMSSSPYYLMRYNVIVVPHGLLQEPFFAADSHDIFKYSLLGFVLAHELMHSVDTMGLQFDSYGNVHEIDPQISSSPRFEAGVQCLNQNKTQYVDERIADIAGLDLVYSTYFQNNLRRSQTDFTTIPPPQIFFLNLAQFFCGDGDPTNFVDHDNDQMRLQQMLNGFAPFHQAYGCPARSNQSEKCQLW